VAKALRTGRTGGEASRGHSAAREERRTDLYSTDSTGNERDLQDFLGGVSILGLDVEIAQLFGLQRGRLRAAHTVVGDFDLLIGATALRHDLTLLSNNRRHFELIEGLRLQSL
jgi:predicted nucleic acid-binding protein